MCCITPLLRDSDSVCIQAFSLPLLLQVYDRSHIFLVSATLKQGKTFIVLFIQNNVPKSPLCTIHY